MQLTKEAWTKSFCPLSVLTDPGDWNLPYHLRSLDLPLLALLHG